MLREVRGAIMILSPLARCLVPFLFLALFPQDALGQWQITSADGKSTVKLGLLFQGRAEWWMEKVEDGEGDKERRTSQNLYLRRMRFMLGGRVNDRLSFFAETDAPNYGNATADGKEHVDLFLQDAFVTWTVREALNVDMGLILAPGAYNHLQGATSLLPIDYGPYTFLESSPLMAKVGRDTGGQARGIVADKHVEYRLAVLQGVRGGTAEDPFRVAARLSFSPFDAGGGFFYPGTNLGKKKALSFGVGVDTQKDFRALHADAFFDHPLDERRSVTLQASCSTYDGRGFVAIPKQFTYLAEGGFSFLANALTVFGQAAGRRFDEDGDGVDEGRYEAGIAWWADGHKLNLKLGYGLLEREDNPDRNTVTLQCQVFSF